MDPRHRWRKRRYMDDAGRFGFLPEWFVGPFRTRSTKLRMRVVISLVTGFLVVYGITSHIGALGNKGVDLKERSSKQQWRISNRSRAKPVAIDRIVDSQAHAPQLMGPSANVFQEKQRHARPGFVGVGGETLVLQPPPGPALDRDKSRMSPEDRLLNPRMRIADGAGGSLGKVNGRNVGPPGQSHAMHLVEGAGGDAKPEEGVLVAPNVDKIAAAGSRQHQSAQNPVAAGRQQIAQNPVVALANQKLPRYVYLDLSVGPPKVSYLVQILPLIKKLGATGLVLNYEENFPYQGVIAPLRSQKSYTLSDIQLIVTTARDHDLDVIPLVQTLSNTEFILKHKQFQFLQEKPNFLQNLNPAHNDTHRLLEHMLEQVLNAHPGVSHVHIGCEEVYHLGYSPESKAFLEKPHRRTADLYLYHVVSVAGLARKRHPSIKIIIWDSVIRTINADILKRYALGGIVEPMISMTSLEVTLPESVIRKYADAFQSVWVATSFNKPITRIASVPSFYKYISHQRFWLEKLKEMQNIVNIRGLALVGTFKMSHFSPVAAVLLPVALPSLGLCLRTLTRGGFNRSIFSDVTSALECDQQRPFSEDNIWDAFTWCPSYPGGSIFSDFVELRQNVLQMKQIINTQGQKDISPVVRKFEELLTRMPRHLVSIYDPELATEWLEQHLVKNLSPLGGFRTKAKSMIASNVWLKRKKILAAAGTARKPGTT